MKFANVRELKNKTSGILKKKSVLMKTLEEAREEYLVKGGMTPAEYLKSRKKRGG